MLESFDEAEKLLLIQQILINFQKMYDICKNHP